MIRVGIVGGGLAGIAAALDCADAGAEVTLFEGRSRLGGATFSIERDGRVLDNGQHVALRCCTEYRRLIARLGTDTFLEMQPRLSIPVLDPDGRRVVFARSGLPAPLHLAGALLGYRHLPLRERLAAGRAVLALRSVDPADPDTDETPFGDWLRAHGQSQRAIDRLWNLIVLPTLNLRAEDASLAAAAFVFRTGLLDESDACDLGVPTVPLARLHGDAALTALREAGVQVRLRAKVQRLRRAGEGFELDLPGETAAFDRLISAVPHEATPELLPEGVYPASAARLLGASPIVNVHLHYDRPVLDAPFAAAIDSPVQWIFDRTGSSGVGEGQLLALSLSAADEEIGAPQAEIVAAATGALARILPRTAGAVLLDSVVTREPRATFRARPGAAKLRPGPRTDVPGLALAGAWTDTGWPATMEGAVRSGLAAAREILTQPRHPAHAKERIA